MKLLLAVHKRLPLGEASVTVGRAGEREKKTRGTMRRGKRSRALSIFSTRAIMHCSCFRLLLFLLGYPAGATAEERGSINIQILCFRVNYCFLQYEPLIGSNNFLGMYLIIFCDLIGKLCRVGSPGTAVPVALTSAPYGS